MCSGRLWSLLAILLLYGELSALSYLISHEYENFSLAMATGSQTGEGSGITDAQLDSMMSTKRQGLKEELSAMKQELSAEREAADNKLVKKLKLEKALVFVRRPRETVHPQRGV